MSLLRSGAGPLIVAAGGVAMAAATWGTWPDPVVDFGKELYIAWQLSEGQRLYVDVAYHLGPLSPYVNALAFKIFGVSLLTIELLNLSLLAVMVALIYRLIRRMAGDIAATAAGLTFVGLFAFTHFTPIADYNFICPYDHAHTHGILLGLLGLTFADSYVRSGRRWALLAAGMAVGLAFLTRAELFLAVAGAVGWIIFQRRGNKWPVVLAALAPILLALALLATIVPARAAVRGVLGSWPIVLDSSVSANPFYRDSMGTLHPAESLWRLVSWTCWWDVLLLPAMAVGGLKTQRTFWALAALAWGAAGAWLIGHTQNPTEAFAPLPLVLLVCLWFAIKRRRDVTAAGMMIWALILLGKIILNARIYHYGFALAMPATLLVVAVGIGWTTVPVRAAVAGALAVTIIAYLGLAFRLTAMQSYSVGNGNDRFWADQRGDIMNQALGILRPAPREQLPEPRLSAGTLAVVPEGAMLNFLGRMANPTPYWSFNPPYAFFAPGKGEAAGEERMLAAVKAHPPDWIVLVNEDLSDFGYPFFGRDYGLKLNAFVEQNYAPRQQFGAGRFSDTFGVTLMGRVYNGKASSSVAGK